MKTKIPDAVLAAGESRRGLVKTTAIGGTAMASSTLPCHLPASLTPQKAISPAKTAKVVWSACTVNCGSVCRYGMHVVDGEIKYVETDNTGNDDLRWLCIRFAPACAVVLCVVASIADRLKYR